MPSTPTIDTSSAAVGPRGSGRRSTRSSEGFVLTGESTPLRQLVRDLWGSRDLLFMLARKDFFVRYRRASFGMVWAAGVPLLQSTVLALVFSRVIRVETGVPYAPFVFAGMLGWSYFSQVLGTGSTAIVDGVFMSNRIYFPRAVLVLSNVLTNLYTFWITVVITVGVTLLFGVSLGARALLVFPATLLLVGLVTSLVLFTSALHVYFRDVRFIVAAALSAWFFVTPIVYPLELAPGAIEWLIRVNPLTGVVMLFRAALVGSEPGWLSTVWITCGWTVAIGTAATWLHRRFDRVFVDLL